MINYIEKGHGLHLAVNASGHKLQQVNRVWLSSDDTAVQAIIDSHNPIPYERAEAKTRIIKEASKRAADIYPFIDPDSEQAIGLYHFALDLYTATIPAARESISGRLLQFKSIHDKAQAAIDVIDASNDWKFIKAYDAVNGPGW